MTLHPDRLLPPDPATRKLARDLHAAVADLPIISPHGHTDPRWWGENPAFSDPAQLFVTPDHYVTRMLTSQGVPFEAMGIGADARPIRARSGGCSRGTSTCSGARPRGSGSSTRSKTCST
ncbi:uronate isomerase [Limimaricola cinnabarinus LL-001]|uniref:Uronate isomerase n=1 Tax=Limimaricola cinnabarinus LL-001 TaxID=1337093 RepID=U2Z8Q2_9RHOB|nr:uronate isomerase [Limimaricola cinnabarinus LL-001]